MTVSGSEAISGMRSFGAIVASVVAFLGLIVLGGLTLPSGSLPWRILSPIALAISSAILISVVPGVNTFRRTKPKIIAIAIAVVVVLHLARWNVKPEMAWINEIRSYPMPWQILLVLTFCVVSPILEEIYFRGLLFPIIGLHWGLKTGAVLTGIAFLVLHISFGVFLATVILTLLTYFSRSVYPSIAAHIAFNSMLFLRAMTWHS
jgi:membrane protease YdiL (CAAX protease family)